MTETADFSSPVKKIGYIGLGNAGYPLASTLTRAGYNLTAADADSSRASTFAKEHAKNATAADLSNPQAFADVDVLITMLPNGDIFRDVLLGSAGVAAHLKSNAIIVDTSSASPHHTQETNEQLQVANPGVVLLDSPITQAYAHALAKGDATLMVGCSDAEALERVMPVLRIMGKYVFVMGGLGAGHAMKTLNNYVSGASIVGLCDALVAGERGWNLDPAQMLDVMNVGTGINFSIKEAFRTDALTRKFQSGYQLSLLLKDMKIARNVIDQSGMHSQLSDLIVDSFADADKVAGPGADHTQVIQRWEKSAGFQLRRSKSVG